MRLKMKMLVVALFASVIAFGVTSTALAAPSREFKEQCVEDVLDLPALDVCKDEQGRHLMELPAIGILREPATPAPADKKLPKTGVNVGDFAAIGAAALAGGSVLLRRLRLAVS
jgi:LPXTG-motif cell wall-anchored protein